MDFTLWERGTGQTYGFYTYRFSEYVYIIMDQLLLKRDISPRHSILSTILKLRGYTNIHYNTVSLVIDVSLYISRSDAHCYVTWIFWQTICKTTFNRQSHRRDIIKIL